MFKRSSLEKQIETDLCAASSDTKVKKYKDIYTDFITDLINKLKEEALYSNNDKIEIEKIKKLEEYHAEWEDTIDKIERLDIAIRYETNSLLFESYRYSKALDQGKMTKALPFSAAWGYDLMCDIGPVPLKIQQKAFKITSLFAALGNRIMQIYDLRDKVKCLFTDSRWNDDINKLLHNFFNNIGSKGYTELIEDEVVKPIIKAIRKEKSNQRITQKELVPIIQKEFVAYVKAHRVEVPHFKKMLTQNAIIKMLNDWNSFLSKKKGKVIEKNKPYPGYPEILYDTDKNVKKWAKNTFAPYYIKDLYRRKNRAKKTDALDGPHYGGDEGELKIDEERSTENTGIYFDDPE